jgi:hypothetical protein
MKKLLLIILATFFWTNFSFAEEDIYCLDIYNWDFVRAYKVSKKNSSYGCDDYGKEINRPGVEFITVDKYFYDNAPFIKGSYPKSMPKKEFNKIRSQYGLQNTFSETEKKTCEPYLDWSYSIQQNQITINFTNNDNKPMQISGIYFYTENSKFITRQELDIYIKPFGKFSRNFNLTDLNTDIIEVARLGCKILNKEKKQNGVKLSDLIDDKNSRSDKKSFFENYIAIIIVVSVIILAMVMQTLGKKNNPKNSNTFSQSSQNIKSTPSAPNLIELVWNGSLPLGQTFWFYYVVVNIIVGFVAGFLMEIYESKWIFIIPGLTAVWAGVGTWNSATNYQLQKIKSQQPYGWVYGAKAVVVFGFISLLGQLGNLLK